MTLVEVITDFLDGVPGRSMDCDPKVDDIVEVYRRETGIRTKAAAALVNRRLPVALRILEEDGRTPVRVTEQYVARFKGKSHPEDDADIIACLAGLGSGMPTYALHFCVDRDCVLWIESVIQKLETGEGHQKNAATKMNHAAEAGLVSLDGVEKIVKESGVVSRPDIRKVIRIAGRVGQRALKVSGE